MPVCSQVLWVSYSKACKTGNRGDAERMRNECINVILCDNVRNIKKAVDDNEVLSLGSISLTLQLAVHEGLLSQCSITDSPANIRKVAGQCCNSICRIRKSHIKVFTLFQQNKKTTKEQLGCGYVFFLMQLYYPGKILVKAKYRIGTRYRHLVNIKGLGLGLG